MIGSAIAQGKPGSADDVKPPPPRPVTKYPLIDYDPKPLPVVRLSPRPRIWFNAAEVLNLRKRCEGELKNLLAAQKREVEGDKPRSGSGVLAFDLAFLYQMTGDADYAKRAIDIARQAKPFQYYSWHATNHPMGAMYLGQAEPLACVYDWCYDQMNEADRRSIGKVIRQQLSHGPYHAAFHEPWYMCVWLSQVLALHGAGIDDQLAEDQLQAYNRAIHQFVHMADSIHADGATGDYGYQYMYFHLWPEMWMRATGENLFKSCGFYRTQPEYLLHTIRTTGHWLPGDGDAGFDGFGAKNIFAYYGWRNDNPYARGLAREMSKNFKAWPNSGSGMNRAWMSILWHDNGTETRPLTELPKSRLFPSNQVAVLRSGWDLSDTSTDTLFALYCRPWEGHCHRDAGHFVIWRGKDQLLHDGGFYASTNIPYHSDYFTATVAHNCLLIYDKNEPPLGPVGYGIVSANDGGQTHGDAAYYGRMSGGSFRGQIFNFTDEPRFTYLFADITPAYSAAKAVRVARALLYIKPSTYVVCDWIASTQPDSIKRFVLNTAQQPWIDGAEKLIAGKPDAGILESSGARRAAITRGSSKLHLQLLSPQNAVIRRVGGEGYGGWVDGKNYHPPPDIMARSTDSKRETARRVDQYWRLEIEPIEPSKEVIFLTLLDATDANDPVPQPATLINRDNGVGTMITRGEVKSDILFHRDGRATVDGHLIGKTVPPFAPAGARK